MKTIQTYKLLMLFLLIPIIGFATIDPKVDSSIKEKHTKEKIIKKSFHVASNAMLKINNSYGNLDIVTWNENRIEIVVTITTKGNVEDKVQRKLDDISVDRKSTRLNSSHVRISYAVFCLKKKKKIKKKK